MTNGGKRTGAGRPKGSSNKKNKAQRIEEAVAREFLVKRVLAYWEPIIDVLLCTALGKKLPKRSKNPPSPEYCEKLIDRIVPKPKPPLDASANVVSPELVQIATALRAIAGRKDE